MKAQLIRESSQENQLWISGQMFAHNIANIKDYRIGAICSIGSDAFNFP